jgi:hypothetical protein
MPLNVPSAVAQKECIQQAYARAGRNETDVDFVELHITGLSHHVPVSHADFVTVTGTAVGDPIEANAAAEIFARSEYVDVGTVKGNIGSVPPAVLARFTDESPWQSPGGGCLSRVTFEGLPHSREKEHPSHCESICSISCHRVGEASTPRDNRAATIAVSLGLWPIRHLPFRCRYRGLYRPCGH